MRVCIVGNSGSGKSTLAKRLQSQEPGTGVFELDSIAWKPGEEPVRQSSEIAAIYLKTFCQAQNSWIVEGCYGELIQCALACDPILLFLNPTMETCIKHCKDRAFEPAKYKTATEQAANLERLLAWVTSYYSRSDDMSLAFHRALFDSYQGKKQELSDPRQISNFSLKL